MRAYHFVDTTLRDGRPVPADGVWLEHDGPVNMCNAGLHASVDPFDALQYAPGPILCLVDLEGEIIADDDKVVASRRRIVHRIDATDLLRTFARQCALDVAHLWAMPDVVRRYLETGDKTLRAAAEAAARVAAWAAWAAAWAAWAAEAAARDAARNAGAAARNAAWAAAVAARDAARDARAAARNAAWAAARATQRTRFTALVEAAFEAMS